MDKLKYYNNDDKWLLAEDIPDMDFFFSDIWITCFTNEFEYPTGRAYQKVLGIYKGFHLWFYFGEKDSKELGDHLVNKFLKNPNFTKKINKQIIIEADKLRNFAKKLPGDNLNKLTNKKLWQIYKQHDKIHTQYYQWCWIPVAVDMFHNNLTEKLKQFLRSINITENKINEYLVILTQPTKKSLIQIEQEDFLKIAIKINKNSKQKKIFSNYFKLLKRQATLKLELNIHTPEYEKFLEKEIAKLVDKIDKTILKEIEKYYYKYFYVKFMWIGKEGVTSFEYYLKEMARLIASKVNTKKNLDELENEFKKNIKKRNNLIKKLKIKNPWKTILDSWGDFMVTKIYRRYAQIFAIYKMQPILKEIAKRLEITEMQVKFMRLEEIQNGLLNNKINRANLKQRTKLCVYYTEKNKSVVWVGEKAQNITKKLQRKNINNINEISGQTGCIGKATGKVKIIIRPADMNKMEKGDVLVSIATDPDIVPAMKKASAIVTEQGGVTSHAAIVSREMNIPCVIGTKIATKTFKDGDLVEVDAYKGIVKKIK